MCENTLYQSGFNLYFLKMFSTIQSEHFDIEVSCKNVFLWHDGSEIWVQWRLVSHRGHMGTFLSILLTTQSKINWKKVIYSQHNNLAMNG